MSWVLKERLQRILQKESGSVVYPPGSRAAFALAYPNSYYVGMSNLGMHILYQQMNGRGDTACERFFMPDKESEKEYTRTNTPLLSIENQKPLYEFNLIGFAVSFEMDYFHVVKMLALGKVKLLAEERLENDPIVIAGGPCSTFNPEPLSAFVDVFVVGEGEETMHRLLDAYYSGIGRELSREEILLELAHIPGIYVPRFYRHHYDADGILTEIEKLASVPDEIERQWVENLDKFSAHTVIFTDDTEFGGLYLVEIARGCGRHCRFCMAGYCFRRPRNRSLQALKETLASAKKYSKKVGLMGAAISDYPEIDPLCSYILDLPMQMSVASFRADSVTETFVHSLAKSGAKSLTLAPEAGSERMRAVINKGITEEHLFNAIDLGVKAGILNFRLYIMVGLPFETEEDIAAIVVMAEKIKAHMESLKSRGCLTLSINPFIPKPMTPFQWLPMAPMKTVESRLKYIKTALKARKGIEVLIESPKEAYIQAALARGDRRMAKVLYDACQLGGSKAFKRALKENGLDEDFYLYRLRGRDEVLPWDVLHMGFAKEYLTNEMARAQQLVETRRCFDGCKRCGICK